MPLGSESVSGYGAYDKFLEIPKHSVSWYTEHAYFLIIFPWRKLPSACVPHTLLKPG